MSEAPAPTILVVDDNAATLYTTSRVLGAAGFQVRQAATGQAGLEAALQDVALVVLDVNLPDMSGFEVCRRLRSDPRTSHLPVIHLSATFVKDVHKVQGFEIGADGYLTHPVEPPVLVATVQAFLRTRQAEENTRRSEAKFRSVFDKAPSGIVLLDERLHCLEANAALSVMFCRSSEQLIGSNLAPLLSAQDDAAERIARAVAQQGVWRGSSSWQTGPGQLQHFDWTVSRHALPGVYLALVNDVTALVSLEEDRRRLLESERNARAEAERANRMKDEFLATLAHDLRSPLGAIVNWCRVLQRPGVRGAELADAVRAIERNAAVQVQMIADLLDVSRIASGKLRLRIEGVDAESLVDGALDVIRAAAEEKGITLGKSVTLQARWLFADSARLQQVIWNLLSNAVKFTGRGGHVEVSLRSNHDWVQIAVHDNGQGIAADLLPRVFDRFRQGRQQPQQDGLGLGLSIVRHIVEAHGGTVAADSEGPGRGAVFTVRLPAHDELDAPGPQAAVSQLNRLDGIRVLVVDDDAEMRSMLSRVLQEQGAQVATAEGHGSAMAMLRQFAPHVLVSDIGMPERDGYQLIRDIRAAGFDKERLPAVAVTAFDGEIAIARSLDAGFQHHLSKPVVPGDLAAAIAQLVGSTNRTGRQPHPG